MVPRSSTSSNQVVFAWMMVSGSLETGSTFSGFLMITGEGQYQCKVTPWSWTMHLGEGRLCSLTFLRSSYCFLVG